MWHEFKYSVYYTWSLLPYLFQNSYRFHIRYISLYNLTLPSASDESHENMLFQTIYNYTNNPDCHLFLEEIKHYLSFFKFIKRLKHYIHRSDVFTSWRPLIKFLQVYGFFRFFPFSFLLNRLQKIVIELILWGREFWWCVNSLWIYL